jgi:hypothetical protein
MFVPSLKEYDFVLRLEPRFTASKLRPKASKFKNLQKQEATDQDIAKMGLNVVDAFLEELSVSSHLIPTPGAVGSQISRRYMGTV